MLTEYEILQTRTTVGPEFRKIEKKNSFLVVDSQVFFFDVAIDLQTEAIL